MAIYYCFECCLVFDASINPPTEVKKNMFNCQMCADKNKTEEYKPDEADEWLSIKAGVLGATNKK